MCNVATSSTHIDADIFVEMARTRGGVAAAAALPRIYMTPLGFKVRKVHGGHVFQPPTLKVCSYLALDKLNTRAGQPRSHLYEGVQKFMDHLLEQVEDRLLGLDATGIPQRENFCNV